MDSCENMNEKKPASFNKTVEHISDMFITILIIKMRTVQVSTPFENQP